MAKVLKRHTAQNCVKCIGYVITCGYGQRQITREAVAAGRRLHTLARSARGPRDQRIGILDGCADKAGGAIVIATRRIAGGAGDRLACRQWRAHVLKLCCPLFTRARS